MFLPQKGRGSQASQLVSLFRNPGDDVLTLLGISKSQNQNDYHEVQILSLCVSVSTPGKKLEITGWGHPRLLAAWNGCEALRETQGDEAAKRDTNDKTHSSLGADPRPWRQRLCCQCQVEDEDFSGMKPSETPE